MEKERIPIIFCIDNIMVMPLGVAITSLVLNAGGVVYDIYIVVDETVSENDKDRLKSLESYFQIPFTITFIEITNKFNSVVSSRSYWSKANYYRLLLPELFPQFDMVIYSDADIIFQSSLKDVYKSLGDNFLAASQDNMKSPLIQEQTKLLELKVGQIYFCAGFLVLNLQKLRDNNLVSKSLELVKRNFKCMDQDVLNFLCKGKVVYLSPFVCRFSIQTHPINPMEEKYLLDDDNNIRSLNEAAIHYIGRDKPWNSFCHRWEVWWYYYTRSPFFDANFYWQHQHDYTNGDFLSLYQRIKLLIRYFVGKDSAIRKFIKKLSSIKNQ